MCKQLGIRIIAANSPQAKGRVERNHGTHQDRLVKKLRRKKIRTHEGANEYLKSEYLADHNRRFARVRRPRRKIITIKARTGQRWMKSFGWRRNG